MKINDALNKHGIAVFDTAGKYHGKCKVCLWFIWDWNLETLWIMILFNIFKGIIDRILYGNIHWNLFVETIWKRSRIFIGLRTEAEVKLDLYRKVV